MIYNVQTISKSLANSISNTNINNNDSSFFLETLESLSEENKEFQLLINEGLLGLAATSSLLVLIKKFNPKKIIEKIVDKFLSLLDNLWRNFKAQLLYLFGKDNVIKHYKNELLKINSDIKYNEDRFNYTNIGITATYTSFKNELDKEFNKLLLNLSKLGNFKTYEELFSEISNIENELNNTDYDIVRGKMLNSNNSIESVNFANELYKYFRNGGEVVTNNIVTSDEIRRAVDEYFNNKKILLSIEKDKSDLEKYAKKLQKDIKSINIEDYIKQNLPKEAEYIFIELLKSSCTSIKTIVQLYSQLFSAKLDAAKEMYIQNSKVLITACKYIVREG